ncbi:MAG: hypothetical protein R2703_06010 [Micropruina glycogenica]
MNATANSNRSRRSTEGLSPSDLDALDYGHFLDAFRKSGIAAHHAGLLPAFKEAGRSRRSRGLVKVVFATETLAGHQHAALQRGRFSGWSSTTARHAPTTPGEYTQLTGRAGRRGIDVEATPWCCRTAWIRAVLA